MIAPFNRLSRCIDSSARCSTPVTNLANTACPQDNFDFAAASGLLTACHCWMTMSASAEEQKLDSPEAAQTASPQATITVMPSRRMILPTQNIVNDNVDNVSIITISLNTTGYFLRCMILKV